MPRNFMMIFYGTEGRSWALVAPGGVPRRGQPTRARQEAQAPWWLVPTSGAPRTASLLYKYPNIPETIRELTEFSSSRRRVQNHQI